MGLWQRPIVLTVMVMDTPNDPLYVHGTMDTTNDPPYSPGTTIVDFSEVCMSCLVKARLDITEITEIRLTNDSCLRVVSHPKMILLFTSTI